MQTVGINTDVVSNEQMTDDEESMSKNIVSFSAKKLYSVKYYYSLLYDHNKCSYILFLFTQKQKCERQIAQKYKVRSEENSLPCKRFKPITISDTPSSEASFQYMECSDYKLLKNIIGHKSKIVCSILDRTESFLITVYELKIRFKLTSSYIYVKITPKRRAQINL